jgi:hypothetical protein
MGGEQQLRALRVTSLTCTKQAKAEVDRSFDAVDEAHGLGLEYSRRRDGARIDLRSTIALAATTLQLASMDEIPNW